MVYFNNSKRLNQLGNFFKILLATRLRRWFTGIFTILLIGGYFTLASAPYLPRLLDEAYPQFRWPAPGYFTRLEGVPTPDKVMDSPSRRQVDAWSRELFESKNGTALIIWKDGKIVKAHYAQGISSDERFNSYSLVKSLVGALVLKALAENRISSLDISLSHFWPLIKDKKIGQVTLMQLLKMRTGIIAERRFDKRKPVSDTAKNLDVTRFNPFGFMVRLHMTGIKNLLPHIKIDQTRVGVFEYQNVNTAILGAVLEKLYEIPLEQLLSQKIWKPAGISHASWRRYSRTKPVTPYCCVYAKPADWIKIGVFFLKNGPADQLKPRFLPVPLWNQLMGAEYTDQELHEGSRYGLHVYHNILDRPGESLQGRFTYFFGSKGQVVYLMPLKNLIVVRFGEGIQKLHSTLYAASRNFN